MATNWYDELTSTPEGMAHYQEERVVLEATELICELMERRGVNKAELAKRLGKSRPYITRLLNGSANMTLRTISNVLLVLGRSLHVISSPLSLRSRPNISLDFDWRNIPVSISQSSTWKATETKIANGATVLDSGLKILDDVDHRRAG